MCQRNAKNCHELASSANHGVYHFFWYLLGITDDHESIPTDGQHHQYEEQDCH